MESSKPSTAPARSSRPISRARTPIATSSRTRSASSTTEPVLIALGSNLGDRRWHLHRAVDGLRRAIRLVRISSIHETAPVDAPPGSPHFLNMVVAGLTTLAPQELLEVLLDLEARLGRVRSVRNAPRVIDLDLIFHGARRIRSATLAVPHPRYQEREFVLAPLREIGFPIQRVP